MVEKPKPTGRIAVKEAILNAAEELFSQHGVAAVSVRDIAKHANVNQGLLHRHFKTKENLRLQVLDRLAKQARVRIGEPTDLTDTIRKSMQAVKDQEKYFRLMARTLLDSEGPFEVQSEYPLVAALVAKAEQAQEEQRLDMSLDPRIFIAGGLAQVLGLLIYADYILPATGLQDLNKDEAVERIVEDWRRLAMLDT